MPDKLILLHRNKNEIKSHKKNVYDSDVIRYYFIDRKNTEIKP